MFDLPYYKLLFAGIFNSFCSAFQCGYHLSVINIPADIIEGFVNSSYHHHYGHISDSSLTSLWAFIVTTYSIGAVVGCSMTNLFAEKIGRKNSIMFWNNIIAIVGSVMMGFSKVANSFELMLTGRFIIGIASGLATGLLAVYLTECSPNQHRGFMSSFLNAFVTGTTLVATIISLPQLMGTETLWPYLLAVGIVPAVVQMMATPFIPETPKFVYVCSRSKEKTREVIQYYHGPSANVDAVIAEYEEELHLSAKEVGFIDAIKDFNLRWPIFISCVINVAMVFSGIMAVFSYSTDIFKRAGVDPTLATYATTIMSSCNTIGSIIGLALIDRFNRRTLFLGGTLICVTLDIIFLIFSQVVYHHDDAQWSAYICLVTLLLFVTVFNMGPGPIAWFVSAEMTPQAARSVGSSVSVTFNWTASLVTTLAYPPIQDKVGSYAYLFFIIPTSLALIYLYFKMPETRNKSVEEVMSTWWRGPTPTGLGVSDYGMTKSEEAKF